MTIPTTIELPTLAALPPNTRGFGHIPVLRALDMLKEDNKPAPERVYTFRGAVWIERIGEK